MKDCQSWHLRLALALLAIFVICACASQVRVGSLLDPKNMPGLAHFCEHMLFYASEKYPEEDAYSKFLVLPGLMLSWHKSFTHAMRGNSSRCESAVLQNLGFRQLVHEVLKSTSRK